MAPRTQPEFEKNVFINCPFDYRKALSDISGVDIKHHDDEAEKMVEAVRNWFVETVGLEDVLGPRGIWNRFNDFASDFYVRRASEGFSKANLDMMPIREYINFIRRWLAAQADPA